MSVYLHDIPLEEARSRFQSALEEAGLWCLLGDETIPLDETAIERYLAATIWAKSSSPHYHAAAMDGFAVRAADTAGAQPSAPILLKVGSRKRANKSNEACYVDTGDSLPEAFNAVIPIENVESIDSTGKITTAIRNPKYIRIRSGVTPWSNVRPLGEDIIATQFLLPKGHLLRPIDLGVIAAAGFKEITVTRKPRVAVIPTGSELVPLGTKLQPGDILEYNSIVLAAQVNEWGGQAVRYPITPDNLDSIKKSVQEASQSNDLILLNAGSSAGAEDFSAEIVQTLGTLLVHGVAIRPGHPVILGMIQRDPTSQLPSDCYASNKTSSGEQKSWIPIIGVPGYPVSAALTGEIFVEPLLALWIGRKPIKHQEAPARITRKITSPPGDDDFVRVAMGKVGEHILATPLSRGAGVISSLVHADGLALIPRGIQGLNSGEEVNVSLYRSMDEITKTILCIGSHDMTLDLLSEFLSKYERRFVTVNVGSQAGLIALVRGEAHVAGSHLLDPDSGEYNVTYILKYLRNIPVKIYGFVNREQGLIVKKGNPKEIHDLNDLLRKEINYVNRQRGAGTRVLFDYLLTQKGMNPELIHGYYLEEFTHLNVASSVASGRADCGMGIPAAAQALDLDFVPITNEKYQLIIPSIHADSNLLEPLFVMMKNKEFQEAISRLPGYKLAEMGEIIAEFN